LYQSGRQSSISDAESKLGVVQALPGELRNLLADMEEKSARLEKIKASVKDTGFDLRLQEKVSRAKDLEIRRDELSAELAKLSLQADTRAKLDIKRAELKTKSADVQNKCVFPSPSWLFAEMLIMSW
jgi:DNA repair protein RAD50